MSKPSNYDKLKTFFIERRGNLKKRPDASISIPVNAQGDLETVLVILSDIAKYQGKHIFEVVLAINNYPEGSEPAEVEMFRSMGIVVTPTPSVRRPEEAVCFSARMTGVRAANTDHLLLFDADCRIPNPTALIDWYIERLHSGTGLAYTSVGHYGLKKELSILARMIAHHGARWVNQEKTECGIHINDAAGGPPLKPQADPSG